MGKQLRLLRLFLSPLVLMLALAGCAALRPPEAPAPSAEKRAEFERKIEQLMREDEKTFDTLNRKMDEYQNLLVLCDSIATGKEEGGIAAACGPMLKALRQELDDLSSLLRGGK